MLTKSGPLHHTDSIGIIGRNLGFCMKSSTIIFFSNLLKLLYYYIFRNNKNYDNYNTRNYILRFR